MTYQDLEKERNRLLNHIERLRTNNRKQLDSIKMAAIYKKIEAIDVMLEKLKA